MLLVVTANSVNGFDVLFCRKLPFHFARNTCFFVFELFFAMLHRFAEGKWSCCGVWTPCARKHLCSQGVIEAKDEAITNLTAPLSERTLSMSKLRSVLLNGIKSQYHFLEQCVDYVLDEYKAHSKPHMCNCHVPHSDSEFSSNVIFAWCCSSLFAICLILNSHATITTLLRLASTCLGLICLALGWHSSQAKICVAWTFAFYVGLLGPSVLVSYTFYFNIY